LRQTHLPKATNLSSIGNIETGKPLDLLPDRTADAVLPWLKSHQEIEVVSRDRASAYADACKWKMYFAALRRNTCRILRIVKKNGRLCQKVGRFYILLVNWLVEPDERKNGGRT
jgi:hypothetical protein